MSMNVNKHPLESVWTLWRTDKENLNTNTVKSDHYQKYCIPITTFDTLEGFFNVMKTVPLQTNANFAIFREGHMPLWETFPTGGRFVFRFNPSDINVNVYQIWESICMYTVGECFCTPKVIGVLYSPKAKELSINIWFESADNLDLRVCVRELCKKAIADAGVTPSMYSIQFLYFRQPVNTKTHA